MQKSLQELTGLLWNVDGPTAGSIAPFAQSFDLNEVVVSKRDVQFHTGSTGLQNQGPTVPVGMIHNLNTRHQQFILHSKLHDLQTETSEITFN